MLRRRVVLAAVLLAGCGGAGGAGGAAHERLLLAAASDLAAALPALSEAFREETGIEVETSLGSSGQIANQILHGAPVDVFASADRGWIVRLAAAGRLDAGGEPVLYGYGRLVMLVPPGRRPPASLEELRAPAIRRIALANPEHAPYGAAARAALVDAGLWDELQPRIVIGENVRQAQQYAEAGSVDVALTARALVDAAGSGSRWTPVPAGLHPPLAQTVAAVRDRPRIEAARAFVRFMGGPTARAILERHGFEPPS